MKGGGLVEYPDALTLWPHQIAAIDTVASYLRRRRKAANLQRAALVNVPTGGGKTAIIGVTAHWHPNAARVLVLAPRAAIRDQLALELAGKRGFFPRQGLDPGVLPKPVRKLSSAGDLEQLPADGILVSTIQLIDDLTRSEDKLAKYGNLRDWCDAVFVDEGHYEPARSWSRTIRGLGSPTILVTATPYRNDLKLFDIDPEAVHVTRYQELAAADILRRIDVIEANPAALANQQAFVQSVCDSFVEEFGEVPTTARKLIIRCDGEDTVRQIGNVVRQHALGANGVLCLHERFTPATSQPWEKRQPPDPEAAHAAAVWVHQHKLLEGVDGPSFQAVAFFDVRGSARALVQQVGRVVRNPARAANARALLIDHSDGYLASSWRRYLAYDGSLTKAGILRGLEEIAGQLDRGLPEIIYVDRQFRQRFLHGAAGNAELIASLRLPKRCQLLRAGAAFALDQLRDASIKRFEDASYPYSVIEDHGEAVTILFTAVNSSPLLQDHYFLERTLHVLIVRRFGDVIVFLDTSRPTPDQDARGLLSGAVARSSMAKLLTQAVDSHMVEVSARNAALGPSSVRRRMTTAAALEATPPLLDEFQYVASTVKAARAVGGVPVGPGFASRAVAFGRGGVADSGPRLPLNDWINWVQTLLAWMGAQPSGPDYLNRFAAPLDVPPPDPRPRSVLLDLEEIADQFETAVGQPVAPTQPVEIEDLCLVALPAGAEPNGDFEVRRNVTIVANGVPCPGTVRFDTAEKKYELTSNALAQLYRRTDATRSGSIVDMLNARQAFSILPETPDAIYADNGFYDPRLPLGPGFDPADIGLGDVIIHEPALRGRNSEKGAQNSAGPGGWPVNSVFQWIDTNFVTIAGPAELVVCDDGTNEFCDFIIVSTRAGRPLVQMIHAKAAATGAWVSASKLHDVCGQASKQVGMLGMFAPARPRQVGLWAGAWVGPSGEGTVDARIRRAIGPWNGLAGPDIWRGIERLLRRQDTEREVVLVLGACLNRQRLFNQARANPPSVNSTHALQLLRSTMSAVAGVGARLKVICG